MPAQLNIVGHLGADAEVKRVGDADVASLRVACNNGYGERQHAVWFDVEVWGRPAEWIGRLRKGAAVTVMGELRSREHDGRVILGVRASLVVPHERQGAAPVAERAASRPTPRPSTRGQEDW